METAKLLERVGDRNRFQIFSIIFVCFKWMIVSLTVFLPSYLLATPTFTCGGDTKVLEADACSRISTCVIQQPYTITAHAQLYCEDKYLRDSIISSEFIGSIIGLVVLSILADKLGRKIIIVSTLFFTAIGSTLLTIGAHFTIYFFMYVGLILMGFGGYSLSMVSYSYLSEINNDLWRQKSLIMTYSFWAIGQIMLFPLIRFIQDWQYICLFAFIIPLIILLIMSYFIVETPQFLWVNKKYGDCLESLNSIAKFNGIKQLPSLGVLPSAQQEKQSQKITDTFTKKKFLVPLIVLSLAQVCNNCLYYTTQYSITQLGQSFQLNMLLIGCLQLCSCLITNIYCEKMYRKRWLIIFMVTSGIIGLLIQFTIDDSIFQMILIGISRLLNTFSFALFSLITTESFPTSIRSTGTGISQAMSNVGNMVAPFLVTISGQLKVKSVMLGGFVCIVGGLSMFIVAQTKQVKKVQGNPLLENISAEEQETIQHRKQESKSNSNSISSEQEKENV